MHYWYKVGWKWCFLWVLAFILGCTRGTDSDSSSSGKALFDKKEHGVPGQIDMRGDMAVNVIEQAPDILSNPDNDIKQYLDKVFGQIGKITNKADRVNAYKLLARKACGTSFEGLGQVVGNGSGMNSEANWKDASVKLSNAHGMLVKVVDEVWLRMYIEDVPGEDLFDPCFVLIEKLKLESDRLKRNDSSLYESRVAHVERLFNLFYLKDHRHQPNATEVEKVRIRFSQVVGRPIRMP